jgi:hypothetical protein
MEWQALSMQTTRLRVEVFGFFFLRSGEENGVEG